MFIEFPQTQSHTARFGIITLRINDVLLVLFLGKGGHLLNPFREINVSVSYRKSQHNHILVKSFLQIFVFVVEFYYLFVRSVIVPLFLDQCFRAKTYLGHVQQSSGVENLLQNIIRIHVPKFSDDSARRFEGTKAQISKMFGNFFRKRNKSIADLQTCFVLAIIGSAIEYLSCDFVKDLFSLSKSTIDPLTFEDWK